MKTIKFKTETNIEITQDDNGNITKLKSIYDGELPSRLTIKEYKESQNLPPNDLLSNVFKGFGECYNMLNELTIK